LYERILSVRVLVCGGRDYFDRDHIFETLDSLLAVHDITCIIHGAQSGADEEAKIWAGLTKIPDEPFEADWAKHGDAAGPIRNRRMLKQGKPDMVVAFPGGRGTANMVGLAKHAGIEVMEVPPRNV
jgi:hypothetical protein